MHLRKSSLGISSRNDLSDSVLSRGHPGRKSLKWRAAMALRGHQGRHAERKAMIERSHALPLKRQAEVVSISRGAAYKRPPL